MSDVLDRELPVRTARRPVRPRTTRREDLLTMVFAAWLILGLFVDGWAHSTDKPESFFTPWHAVFYSGFGATAGWMLWIVQRRRADGASGLAAVPTGYGLGLLGVAVFAFGGVFDMMWHEVFGIEVDLEALLSPSHLILFCGGLLVITSPFRAAWSDPDSLAPSFRQFLPVVLSATLATATVAFFLMPFAPTLTGAMTKDPYGFIALAFGSNPETASWMTEEVQLEGYAAILLTTAIFLAPALLLARRWILPLGTLTFLFGVVSTLVASIESFDTGLAFASAGVAGLAGDVLYRRLRPTPERPWRLWVLTATVPAVMWVTYFAILATSLSVGWSVELWSGVCVMSAITGFALALLVAPAPIPVAQPGQPTRDFRLSAP